MSGLRWTLIVLGLINLGLIALQAAAERHDRMLMQYARLLDAP